MLHYEPPRDYTVPALEPQVCDAVCAQVFAFRLALSVLTFVHESASHSAQPS